MSRSLLARLAVVLAVGFVVWLGLYGARRISQDRAEVMRLAAVDTGSVDTIRLSAAAETTVLARRAGGGWSANGFAASSTAVHDLLAGLADSSRSTELVARNAASHALLGVDSSTGQRVVVSSRGRGILEIVTGKRAADYSSGIYVRAPDKEAVYSLKGGLADAFARHLDDWRDKRIASVPADSVVRIEVRRGTSTYAVQRKDSTWQFASGKAVEQSAVTSLLDAFRDLTASGFATPAEARAITFARPTAQTRLLGAGGKALASMTFDSTATAVWVRADTGSVIYRIDTWTFGRLAPAEKALTKSGK